MYGALDASSAPFSVSIDGWSYGQPMGPNTAQQPVVDDSHVLFMTSNLLYGNHTLRIENNPTQTSASGMNISHARILTHASPIPSGPSKCVFVHIAEYSR